jgi:acid stress chaperone HdeA
VLSGTGLPRSTASRSGFWSSRRLPILTRSISGALGHALWVPTDGGNVNTRLRNSATPINRRRQHVPRTGAKTKMSSLGSGQGVVHDQSDVTVAAKWLSISILAVRISGGVEEQSPLGLGVFTISIRKANMKQIVGAAIAIAALLFSGCSASQVINTGGDTKCKDFTTQDEKKQNEEISKMLKDKSGAEPNNLQISTTRLSALTYCQTVGNQDSKISEAPHG